MRLTAITIFCLIIAAFFAIALFMLCPDLVKAYIKNKHVFKITYQFLLISVIGGAIAYLYKLLELEREKRQYLREMHKELLDSFNLAKKVRRDLRALLGKSKLSDPNVIITAENYKIHMERLGDAQLVFEVYAKRATNKDLWFKGAGVLREELKKLEEYLNCILKEYQEKLVECDGKPPSINLYNLPALVEFIAPYKKAPHLRGISSSQSEIHLMH